jgi:peroxiredoxin
MPQNPIPEKGFAQKAVDFSLSDTDGVTQNFDRHQGKGLFLYFFTPGLRGSLTDLNKINKVYQDNQGRKNRFEFLGICAGCSRRQARMVKEENRIAFPICPDSDWSVTKSYGISALPVSLVIAPWRTVKYDHVGTIPNMKETFFKPFEEFLGIRLGVWRFKHGTREEKEAFLQTLTPEQRLKVFDREDPRIVRIAKQTPCICPQGANLIQCTCDIEYMRAMYRWINFFLTDGAMTEEQIVQIMKWKYEGEIKKKAQKQKTKKEGEK